MHDDPDTRARALLKRSEALYDEARYPEALAASEEAVELFRRLLWRHGESYHHDLAEALGGLACDLDAAGRATDAAVAREEVVEIRRALVEFDPVHRGDLAEALEDFASGMGWAQRDTCVAAMTEAVALYRALAAEHFASWAGALARASKRLVHLQQIWSMGEPTAVRAAAEDAVDLMSRLADDAPEVWTEALIDTLGLLSQQMPLARRLAWTAEAVERAREMAPDARAAALADALEFRALALAAAGDDAGVIATHDEVVALHRALAADGDVDHRNGLAIALSMRADALRNLGRPAEALASIDEAEGIFRGLVELDAGHLRGLVIELESRRDVMLALGRPADALAPAEEAVACGQRRLEVEEPVDVWTRGELHRAQAGLAEVLLALGRVGDAAAAADAAIDTLWPDMRTDRERASGWLQSTVDLRAKIGALPGAPDDGGRAARYAALMAARGE